MRVLALVTDAFGGRGGIAQANRDLLSSFAELEAAHEAVVLPRLAPDAGGRLPERVRQLPAVASKPVYAFEAWRRAVSRPRWDLLLCGHLRLAGLAAWLARRSNVPLWIHLHGIEAWSRPSERIRRAVASARLVTSVSRYTRARVMEWSGLDPWRIRVLPDAVSAECRPGPRSERLIRRWSLEGRRIILTVARMSAAERYKGHERVFGALERILAEGGGWAYVIAGEGDDRPRLERQAAAMGLSRHVRFVGRVGEEEKQEWYRTADVLAMPSTGEGFGIVFLEAVRCGARAVGADADGSRDPLRDGQVGRLVAPDDIDGLARAIKAAPGRAAPAEIESAGAFLRDRQREHLRRLLEEST